MIHEKVRDVVALVYGEAESEENRIRCKYVGEKKSILSEALFFSSLDPWTLSCRSHESPLRHSLLSWCFQNIRDSDGTILISILVPPSLWTSAAARVLQFQMVIGLSQED